MHAQTNRPNEGGTAAHAHKPSAGTAAVGPDREQIAAFVDATLRYTSEGSFISVRAFPDGRESGGPSFALVPVMVNGSGLDPVVDAAYAVAVRAAAASMPVVVCPPLAGFTGVKADAPSLREGYVLTVDCDSH